MPVYAELADGRRLEFPDGTDPGVIQSTVKRMVVQSPMQAPEAPGMAESMLLGAGRGTDKLVQGVRQLYNWAAGDDATLAKMAQDEAEKDRLFQPVKDAHPIASAIGETAPVLASGVLTGGTSLMGGAAAGAIPSLLSYGSPEERLKRGAVDAAGGAAGVMLGRGVSRLLKPAGVAAQGAPDAALDAANRIGYKPLPSQVSGNPAMANFENYLLRTPGSSGTMQRVVDANQTALNRAGAKAMGEAADSLDEGVFAAAKTRIGGEFDRLGTITKPDLSGKFLNTLAKIDADNAARGSFRSGEIDKLIDKGLDLAANNNLDGKAYKEIRTALANQSQSAYRAGDATTGAAYKELYSALDDAAKSSLGKADQEAWDVARKQWKAFKTLTKSNVAEAGNVSAARTAAAVRGQGPALRTGQASGELADVARIGEAFKGVQNPNSGQLMNQMMFSNPITGLPMLATNKALAAAYMSPLGQRYLSRGLLDIGPTGQALLGRAGVQATVPAGRGLLGVE